MSKPFFKIHDNVFDDKTVDTLYGAFRDHKPWYFTGAGSSENRDHRKFFYKLNKEDEIDNILFEEGDKILKKESLYDSVRLVNSYASSYLYGTLHDFHEDGASNYNQIYTIMFYLNKIWTLNYAGETVFLNDDRTEIKKSIIPKPARALIFDGFITHGAREISRSCLELRMVATLKYERKHV
tara:strand:- start:1334 stop:1879 length:546 start_codon:yes stop_codon:yes gene_type:complete